LPYRQSLLPFRWADCEEASMPPSMIRENPEVATSGAAYGEKWWCSVYYTAASWLDTELETLCSDFFCIWDTECYTSES
jgi:hypothetical protein